MREAELIPKKEGILKESIEKMKITSPEIKGRSGTSIAVADHLQIQQTCEMVARAEMIVRMALGTRRAQRRKVDPQDLHLSAIAEATEREFDFSRYMINRSRAF